MRYDAVDRAARDAPLDPAFDPPDHSLDHFHRLFRLRHHRGDEVGDEVDRRQGVGGDDSWSVRGKPHPEFTLPANRDYKPGFTAAMMLKDLLLAYKYGVKTLYYHNTRDGADDSHGEVEDDGCAGGACKI